MSRHLHSRPRTCRSGEDGYVLLTLLLIIALIIIFAAAIVPTIKFQIERDREEELIHRGVQYARAIRVYYKKFGRYPTKIEDLESSNNLRFLRKRYKDPITGKEFKLLHFGEVKLAFSGGIGGGTIPGANPVGSVAAPSGSAFGPNLSSKAGQNAPSTDNPPQGTDTSQASQETGANQPGTQAGSGSGSDNSGERSSAGQPGQTFGGGPIVGVVSFSKKAGYREFNHKKKYNEWQFIYDPGTDRGGLLMTPNQPQLQGLAQQGVQNVNSQSSSSSLGTGSSFGTSPTGMQNNSNSPASGTGTADQQNNPQQQERQ